MQTFLPYPDFVKSAKSLDRERLGKQRLECRQILDVVEGRSLAWAAHPAVKMWMDRPLALAKYAMAICLEWRGRGYSDVQLFWFLDRIADIERSLHITSPPTWLGDERLHASHRAALLAKKPAWYGTFGWKEEPVIRYWWPTKEEPGGKANARRD